MKTLKNYRGVTVRLTAERLAHILEHPEMVGTEEAIEETLASPETVVRSLSDPQVQLYYRFYPSTRVGDKYLCVVVTAAAADTFVLTAYLTDRVKKGNVVWPRKP